MPINCLEFNYADHYTTNNFNNGGVNYLKKIYTEIIRITEETREK